MISEHEVRFEWPKLRRYKFSSCFFIGCHCAVPWLVLLCGYLPCRLLTGACVRCEARNDCRDELKRSLCCTFSLPALWVGVALWLWLVWLVAAGTSELRFGFWYPRHVILGLRGLVLLAVVAWLLAGTIGWPRLVAMDVGRVVFRSRVLIALLLAGISLAGPIAVGWTLFRWLRP